MQFCFVCKENNYYLRKMTFKDGVPLLLFEYLEGGSLHHYIHDVIRSRLDNGSFFSIARDIALALNYLHNQGSIK